MMATLMIVTGSLIKSEKPRLMQRYRAMVSPFTRPKQFAHGRAVEEIEGERVELDEQIQAQILDHPFADPAHAIIAEIAHRAAEKNQQRQQQQTAHHLPPVKSPAPQRQPGIDDAFQRTFAIVSPIASPFPADETGGVESSLVNACA